MGEKKQRLKNLKESKRGQGQRWKTKIGENGGKWRRKGKKQGRNEKSKRMKKGRGGTAQNIALHWQFFCNQINKIPCNCGIGSSLGVNQQVFLDSMWAVDVLNIYSFLFEFLFVRVDRTMDIRFFLDSRLPLYVAEAPHHEGPFPRKNHDRLWILIVFLNCSLCAQKRYLNKNPPNIFCATNFCLQKKLLSISLKNWHWKQCFCKDVACQYLHVMFLWREKPLTGRSTT